MLPSENVETKENKLHIDDFSPNEVASLITFMYTGRIHDSDVSANLLLLGDKYNVHDLVKECEDSLPKDINNSNVLHLLDVASKVSSVSTLLKTAARYILRNFGQIKKTTGWKKLTESNPTALKYILEEMS